jgi:hypothetical protein
VKTVLRVYSIEVAAEKKEDLNEEPIVKRLRKVRAPFSSPLFTQRSVFVHRYFLIPPRLAVRVMMVSDLYL